MLSVAVLVKIEPLLIMFIARSSGFKSWIVCCSNALNLMWAHPIFALLRLLILIFRYPCWVWLSTVRKLSENIGKFWTKL